MRGRPGAGLRWIAVGAAVLIAALAWIARPSPAVREVPRAAAPVAAPHPVAAAPLPAEPAPRPQLALLATAVADNRSRSTATVRDLARHRDEILRFGDSLARHPHVRVEAIGVRFVELSDALGRWRVELAPRVPTPAPRLAELREILASRGLPPSERVDRLRSAGRGLRVRENVFGEATFAPRMKDGRVVALVLTHVEPGGLYDRLGLGAGDLLHEVNGRGFGDAEAFGSAVEALATARSLHLVVESGDERRRVLVDLAAAPQLGG